MCGGVKSFVEHIGGRGVEVCSDNESPSLLSIPFMYLSPPGMNNISFAKTFSNK